MVTHSLQTADRRPSIYCTLCSDFISQQHAHYLYPRALPDVVLHVHALHRSVSTWTFVSLWWRNKRGGVMLNISLMFVNTTVQTWNTQVAADRVVKWHSSPGCCQGSCVTNWTEFCPGHTWGRWSCVCQSTNDQDVVRPGATCVHRGSLRTKLCENQQLFESNTEHTCAAKLPSNDDHLRLESNIFRDPSLGGKEKSQVRI